jgi:hypothetical protein
MASNNVHITYEHVHKSIVYFMNSRKGGQAHLSKNGQF